MRTIVVGSFRRRISIRLAWHLMMNNNRLELTCDSPRTGRYYITTHSPLTFVFTSLGVAFTLYPRYTSSDHPYLLDVLNLTPI
jgi:hypothetical protein